VTLYDLLTAEGDPARVVETAEWAITTTQVQGIHLLHGDERLMMLDLTRVQQGTVNTGVLRDLFARLRAGDVYDWVIVDCPPAYNAASAAALLAVGEVIAPIEMDAFSLLGMADFSRQLESVRAGGNPGLRLVGCLPCRWYRSPENGEAEEALIEAGIPVLAPIRYSARVPSSTHAMVPLVSHSPRCNACRDYRAMVRGLMGGESVA
jgi:chromosome partitioning protein